MNKRTAIEQFSLNYEVPLALSNHLIGCTERETADNIGMFIDYLKSLMAKYHDPAIEWERR